MAEIAEMAEPAEPIDGEVALDAYLDTLARVDFGQDPARVSTRPLDDVSVHDFAYYEYLLPTERGFASYGFLSDAGVAYLTGLEGQGVPAEQIDRLAAFLLELERTVREAVFDNAPPGDQARAVEVLLDALYHRDADLLVVFFEDYLLAPDQADRFFRILRSDLGRFLHETGVLPAILAFGYFSWRTAYANFELKDWWEVFGDRAGDPRPPRYPFEVFPRFSVNLGLRLVYRQEWRPLSAQAGEVVRTIPLGPGQHERVTTKVVRRKKTTNTLESSTAVETDTEATDTTKDSSEIVQEAADSFNWKVDAEVHGGIPLIGGSVNSSFGGASEEKSRATSAQLSEAMRKTAQKVRRETKLVVSVEGEETFESEVSSEIANPNQEAAVTYEYLRLQQQYEVFTHLAEVQSVIYVAETVPAPEEVDAGWVRRHDWVLAQALLDESFRATLNELIQDADEPDPIAESTDNPFFQMADTARGSFARFEQAGAAGNPVPPGLAIPDIYAEPQRALAQHLKEWAARSRANDLRQVRRERLFAHLRDNILHYCRAVWRREDPDQRILRYKREGRRVPVLWRLAPGAGLDLSTLATTGVTRPLWELIDPTGPLGYVGNYAVYGVRPGSLEQEEAPGWAPPGAIVDPFPFSVDLEAVLAAARAPYVDRASGELLDPALRARQREAAAVDPLRLAALPADELEDLLLYLPHLAAGLLKPNGNQARPVTPQEWAEYRYRKDATRRFLVDSANLYLRLWVEEGAALEPFKRAHRYLDVLRAQEDLAALRWKNRRREAHVGDIAVFDPDVAKVVVVDDGGGLFAGHAAAHAALAEGDGAPAGAAPAPGPPPAAAAPAAGGAAPA